MPQNTIQIARVLRTRDYLAAGLRPFLGVPGIGRRPVSARTPAVRLPGERREELGQ